MGNKLSNCILSTDKMAKADEITIDDLIALGKSGSDLMEVAGLSVVREITGQLDGRRALILSGPGNNGGDGFVIARHLKESGWSVELALLGNLEQLKGDAKVMAQKWDGEILSLSPDAINDQDVIIDSIFGTGLSKEISADVKETILKANEAPAYKIAVDIPSGIKGDTGEVLGVAFKADKTVTFCRMKPAHMLYPGKEYCGEIIITDIGISDRTVEDVEPDIFVNSPDLWKWAYPIKKKDGHKYDGGHAVVVSGDMTHTGASRLAAMAALRVGAGLVSVSSPDDALSVHAAHLTAVMIRKRTELNEDIKDPRLNAWCIGPAAGLTTRTRRNVLDLLNAAKRVVLDADALSVFEEGPLELFAAINENKDSRCVLTPHAGEFARLFPYLKHLDKLSAAIEAAKLSGATIIYKGADTVIASPGGRAVITANAPPTLATAGSGDVLAGLVSGLLAQGMPAFEAATAAVWLHGECANRFGTGLISEDLEKELPGILKDIF